MKKHTILLSLFSFLLICLSCSKDSSDKFEVPAVPGIDLQENEIQLVFGATPEENEVFFVVDSKSPEVFINWGDNSKLHQVAKGEVSYVYPAENNSYVITISSPKISGIDLTDARSKNITALYAGECPDFASIKYNKDNLFEAFDLKKCPQFQSIAMQVNRDNFDLSGLENASELLLYVNSTMNASLKGFEHLEEASILFHLGGGSQEATVIENNPKLKRLGIGAFNPYGSLSYNTLLKSLIINEPQLELLELACLDTEEDLDLKNAGNRIVDVKISRCGFPKQISFSPATRYLMITNVGLPYVPSRLETLDLSACEQLRGVQLDYQAFLKTIRLGEAKQLVSFWMQQCPLIEQLNFNSHPVLEFIYCFNNLKLKNITLSDLPGLGTLHLKEGKVFSGLTIEGELPALSSVDIADNRINEEVLLAFLNAIPDELSPAGKERMFKIEGNPGNTEYVRSFIEGKQNWKLIENKAAGSLQSGADETGLDIGEQIGDVIHLKAR